MSLSSLYHIESLEADRAVVRLDGSHPLYRGHFPGNPVTPGVALLQIATDLLCRITARRLTLRTVVSMKFRRPVGPSDVIAYVFSSACEANGQLSAKVSLEADGTQYARMSLLYDIAE